MGKLTRHLETIAQMLPNTADCKKMAEAIFDLLRAATHLPTHVLVANLAPREESEAPRFRITVDTVPLRKKRARNDPSHPHERLCHPWAYAADLILLDPQIAARHWPRDRAHRLTRDLAKAIEVPEIWLASRFSEELQRRSWGCVLTEPVRCESIFDNTLSCKVMVPSDPEPEATVLSPLQRAQLPSLISLALAGAALLRNTHDREPAEKHPAIAPFLPLAAHEMARLRMIGIENRIDWFKATADENEPGEPK